MEPIHFHIEQIKNKFKKNIQRFLYPINLKNIIFHDQIPYISDASLEAQPYTDIWFAVHPLGVSVAQFYSFLVQCFRFSFSTVKM